MKQITMNVPDVLYKEIEGNSDGYALEDLYAVTVLGVCMASKDQTLIKKYMQDKECKQVIMNIMEKSLS